MKLIHHPFFSRMPAEIASHIFQFWVPGPIFTAVNEPSRFDVSVPFVLGAVCRKWRQITWSMRRLWTSASTRRLGWKSDFVSHPCYIWRGNGSIGQASSLCRSMSVSPHFHGCRGFFQRKRHNAKDCAAHQQVCQPLAAPSHSGPPSVLPFFTGDPQGLSILQFPEIEMINDCIFHPDNVRLSPRAVQVAWLPFASIHISWNKVAWVEVKYFSVGESLELLRRAPLLVEYRMYNVYGDKTLYPPPHGFIIHPTIQVLHISRDY